MPPPGPRWVICGQLRPYSETEGASSTPRSHFYPTPSPPNIRSDPERSECIPHSERTPSPQRCPFWQRGSTGSARSGERGREARTRLASSPPQSTAGTAARHGCRAHSTAGPPAGRFEPSSGIPLGRACGGLVDVVTDRHRDNKLFCQRGPRVFHELTTTAAVHSNTLSH